MKNLHPLYTFTLYLHLEEISENTATKVLFPGFFMIHHATAGSHDDITIESCQVYLL